METSTTVQKMLAGNKIFVPAYQRAYSWETQTEKSGLQKQTNTFLADLTDYNKSSSTSPYYFGHFLFEEKSDKRFGVIDGQQRLTTIVIFLSALFTKLKSIRPLNEDEQVIEEDIIKRKSSYRFSTVDYDNQLFIDYIIDQTKKDKNGLDTTSAQRIVNAFDFFTAQLADKPEAYLTKLLNTITQATCTTHPVKDESEAIQMFIFQNNRGKKPSDLEILKAQFMYNIHLYSGEEKEVLLAEIKNRFEKIYKSIATIDYRIDEDEVLLYTLRVHFNSLWESNAIERINKILTQENPISFIRDFTRSLATSFEHLHTFFGKDERENMAIHALVTLGGISIAIPFIIKSYQFGLPVQQISALCTAFESLVLRDRLIGTRADITSRISDTYQHFTQEHPEVQAIIDKVEYIKNMPAESWWWAYWNNDALERSIQVGMNHATAKYLLWKYENDLEKRGKNGYAATRFDKIASPELEHIAPQTPTNNEPIAAGYCEYDEEFRQEYIDCLGNYLLLSKSHNCSVGNKPFVDKRNSYNHLSQQREIQEMTKENQVWSKELIDMRQNKIVDFIIKNF